MEILNLEDFQRGWFIGDFSPSVIKTDKFEVGLLSHKKGEYWPRHVHKIADEINVLVSGSMSINGRVIREGQIFIIEKGYPSKATFLEDCKVLVVKIPSIPGDKYELI